MPDIHNNPNHTLPNFGDTATAFSHLSDSELKKAAWLFKMMNRPWLVKYGSSLGLFAVNWRLPFAEKIIRNTIFEQFVGGSTLLDCQKSIDRLATMNTVTVLDYGAEAKETETDFNHTMTENIRAIDFATQSGGKIPVISTKITGLGRFSLFERIQHESALDREALTEYRNVLKRLDTICYHAAAKGVSVFIDAEESWIQDTLDHLVWLMMKRYNKERVVVYNTFQMYRHDRLQFLIESFDRAKEQHFLLGAKLVRGAYMEKERIRAATNGYPSPINPDKNSTDDLYNTALRFCVDNLDHLAVCNASHNAESNMLLAELMQRKSIPANHPHVLFSQLYGMSDNLTFNLAKAGYRVGKYMPYGQVQDVIPYLIRRAQENTSVTGDAGRELSLIKTEVTRRGI